MLSFNSGLSGLKQFQEEMDVIGNNIANVNTTGYRSSRVQFADTFSNTLRGAATSNGTEINAVQVGTGVQTAAISSNFSKQGSVASTGVNTEMGIQGDGFFIVRNNATGETFATRDGSFTLDSNGYLVNSQGMRVQGYSDSTLTTLGDIKIDNTRDGTTPLAYTDSTNTTAAPKTGFSISEDGTILVTVNGTNYTRGQVLLQNFNNPNALIKEGGNMYSGLSQAGPLSQMVEPKTNGVGSIASSSLEGSNVDLSEEMTSMIIAQRAFQASSKIITTSDEMLQEVINLKR